MQDCRRLMAELVRRRAEEVVRSLCEWPQAVQEQQPGLGISTPGGAQTQPAPESLQIQLQLQLESPSVEQQPKQHPCSHPLSTNLPPLPRKAACRSTHSLAIP